MNNIWQNIFKLRQKHADEIDKILLNIPVFQDLNHHDLRTIKRILHQREYRTNELIFSQGEVGRGMYIIVRGAVEIICNPGRHVLAELQDGDFFGELALLDEAPRSATAVAKKPCTLLCFFKPILAEEC